MDLSKVVDADQLYTLDVLHPVTDEPVGITAKIRSAGSTEAKRVLREHTNKLLERRIKGKNPKAEQIEAQELEKVASYIASWDWGANDWNGKKPDMTIVKEAVKVLDEAGWIYGQIVEAANKIENFSTASVTNSPKPLK